MSNWTVFKRYSEIHKLYTYIRSKYGKDRDLVNNIRIHTAQKACRPDDRQLACHQKLIPQLDERCHYPHVNSIKDLLKFPPKTMMNKRKGVIQKRKKGLEGKQ